MRGSGRYVLDGKLPVEEPDLLAWGRWMQDADRCVRLTVLEGGVRVSTVFLGLDHGFLGPPILFETMVFGGPEDCAQQRYATWEEAEKGHDDMVRQAISKSHAFVDEKRARCAGCGAEQPHGRIRCDQCGKPLVFPA